MTGKRDYLRAIKGDAGIKSAKELATDLMSVLDKHQSVRVDTTGLVSADITTIQTLLAARKMAESRGKAFAMAAPLAKPLSDLLAAQGLVSPGHALAGFWTEPNDTSEGTAA